MKKKFILFVCCGNRERSVIAERLLYKRLEEEYAELLGRVELESAGIFPRAYLENAKKLGVTFVAPYFKKSPNICAVKHLADKGIDVSSYRSKGLTKRMVQRADLILAMDTAIKDEVIDLHSEASVRVLSLKEFVFGADCPNLNIGDPMKLPEIDKNTGGWIWPEGYAADYIGEIEQCLDKGMDKFLEYIRGAVPLP
jgi:protein-tyrosine-phosphatase